MVDKPGSYFDAQWKKWDILESSLIDSFFEAFIALLKQNKLH